MNDQFKVSFKDIGDKRVIRNRISRVRGQLEGIIKMVDSNRYSEDLLIQISSAEKALKAVSNIILEKFVYESINSSKKMSDDHIKYIVELCKKFND